MVRPMTSLALCFVTLSLTQGCIRPAVVQGNPRPNIDLPTNSASFALAMDEAVQDQYVAEANGKQAVEISEWRQTLHNGFRSGFASAFKPAEGKADLTLRSARGS